MIRRGEHLRVEVGGRKVALERRSSLGGGAQFRLSGVRHAREPVKPLGVEWGQSGRADRAEYPLWQERGACQRRTGTIRGGVVDMQRAPVAQLEISLCPPAPSLLPVTGPR